MTTTSFTIEVVDYNNPATFNVANKVNYYFYKCLDKYYAFDKNNELFDISGDTLLPFNSTVPPPGTGADGTDGTVVPGADGTDVARPATTASVDVDDTTVNNPDVDDTTVNNPDDGTRHFGGKKSQPKRYVQLTQRYKRPYYNKTTKLY